MAYLPYPKKAARMASYWIIGIQTLPEYFRTQNIAGEEMNFTSATSWLTCFNSRQSTVDAILILLLIVTAITANALVLIVIYRFPAFRTSANVYIGCLACADIAVGSVPLPMSFALYACDWNLDEGGQMLFAILDIFCSTVSIASLTAIACDRYFAIVTPYLYEKVATVYSSTAICLLAWAYGILAAILRLFMDFRDYTMFIVVVAYILPAIVMIGCYTRIGLIAQEHWRKILSLQVKQHRDSLPSCVPSKATVVGSSERNVHHEYSSPGILTLSNESLLQSGAANHAQLSRNKPGKNHLEVAVDKLTRQLHEIHSISTAKSAPSRQLHHTKDERGICNEAFVSDGNHKCYTSAVPSANSVVAATRTSFRRVAIRRRDLRLTTTLGENGFRRETHRLLRRLKNWRLELKSSLILAVVMGSFLSLWTPFIAVNLRFYICMDCNVSHALIKYFKLLHYSNSVLNPAIYVLLNSTWRHAVKSLLARYKARKLRNPTRKRVQPASPTK